MVGTTSRTISSLGCMLCSLPGTLLDKCCWLKAVSRAKLISQLQRLGNAWAVRHTEHGIPLGPTSPADWSCYISNLNPQTLHSFSFTGLCSMKNNLLPRTTEIYGWSNAPSFGDFQNLIVYAFPPLGTRLKWKHCFGVIRLEVST